MKTTSRVAIAAAAGLFATNAIAADLGGNCCADLEERVAELEATTARKGNRKVSLTVYGQVNIAVIGWSDDVTDEDNTYIVTNNAGRSRFGFRGSANIDSEWSAGYLIEIGVRRNGSGSVLQNDPRVVDGLDIRHEALYVDSKRLGRVWYGHTSSAADGITEINLGGTSLQGPDKSWALGNFAANGGSWNALASRSNEGWSSGEGSRREIIRYISPAFAGFTASAAWGGDDFWDVSLRYANEFNGVRVAAGIGYQNSTQEDDAGGFGSSCVGAAVTGEDDCHMLGLSASIMHVPTGLYIAGSYGYFDDEVANIGKDEHYYIAAGIQRKFFAMGATTVYGEYGNYDRKFGLVDSSDVTMFAIGIDQAVDAAAMNFYFAYQNFQGERTGFADSELSMVVSGAVIRF